jgi:modulator of FtsH protease
MASMDLDPSAWTDVGAAIVAAAAALAGLIFVALSINLDRILQLRGVADLALQGVVVLTAVLFGGIVVLVPGQTISVLAAELVVLGVGLLAVIAWLFQRTWRESEAVYRAKRAQMAAVNGLPGLCFALGGLTAWAGTGGGLYWLVPAWMLGMLAGIVNAWVLLVEVKR